MASALQPEIWRPNMPGVRELITYSNSFYIFSFFSVVIDAYSIDIQISKYC